MGGAGRSLEVDQQPGSWEEAPEQGVEPRVVPAITAVAITMRKTT